VHTFLDLPGATMFEWLFGHTFDPEQDIPNLQGKVILVTGGKWHIRTARRNWGFNVNANKAQVITVLAKRLYYS
jgi:hypothetical protein